MVPFPAAVVSVTAVALLLTSPTPVRGSPTGWPFDGYGARYGEGYSGYGERLFKDYGTGFGNGVYGDGFGGYGLDRYGEGYGGGYGGVYKGWSGSFLDGPASRNNVGAAKYSIGDAGLGFLESPKYDFKYGTDDFFSGGKHSHNEFRDGEKVVGVYTLKEPGGLIRTVKYTADDVGGFRASVVNSGGSDGFPGGAYGYGDRHGLDSGTGASFLENIQSALGADVEERSPWGGWGGQWGRWAGGAGGGSGSGSGGVWGAYGAGLQALPGGYALHGRPEEGYF